MTDIEDATPAEIELEEKRLVEQKSEILDYQQRGWIWNETKSVLTHQDNPDWTIFINPYNGQKLISPAIVEDLREFINRDKHVGGQTETGPPSSS